MKAKCINFNGKTKSTNYGLYINDTNKIRLDFDFDYKVYISLNDKLACFCDYDNFLNNISDFIYNAIQKDIFNFNFSDVEFTQHFKNVSLKWL
jgi:hypothetical protein